ncbi:MULTISPECIES: CinA family protein [unclassified Corynebacterium]|uniref:CinA family protein n=1 Tax=unclassified Corynebacterium TaxID=2624378 RepID=UPI003524A940
MQSTFPIDEVLPERVVAVLRGRGDTVAFCESLTAGLATAVLAGVPGASKVLRGGLVTYATELKITLAGVDRDIVDTHGVISPECAQAMALGVKRVCGADWGVSLTGVAGPDPQDGKPVGEVWIGFSTPSGETHAYRANSLPDGDELLRGNRNEIRHAAVMVALRQMLQEFARTETGA